MQPHAILFGYLLQALWRHVARVGVPCSCSWRPNATAGGGGSGVGAAGICILLQDMMSLGTSSERTESAGCRLENFIENSLCEKFKTAHLGLDCQAENQQTETILIQHTFTFLPFGNYKIPIPLKMQDL